MKNDYLNIYNNLIKLTRNKNLYLNLKNNDTFSDRLIILLFHYSFFIKFYKSQISIDDSQNLFDFIIRQIELSIREIGYGDVSVNKKMKDLNKIFYDILLKIDANESSQVFKINYSLVIKYFNEFDDKNPQIYEKFEDYFSKFYNFCFELPLDNMLRDAINFRN